VAEDMGVGPTFHPAQVVPVTAPAALYLPITPK
jgi:hypothetical protein